MAGSKWSGLFPLALYLVKVIDDTIRGVPWDSLWMCHLSNLLMGCGTLFDRPIMVRTGVLWVLLGTPLWVRELSLDPDIGPVSYLSHLGGLAFALVWLARVEPSRLEGAVWPQAWGLFLAVRAVCGWAAPPALNVNASAHIRDGLDTLLSSYWQYWTLSSLVAAFCLLALDLVVRRLGQKRSRAIE